MQSQEVNTICMIEGIFQNIHVTIEI